MISFFFEEIIVSWSKWSTSFKLERECALHRCSSCEDRMKLIDCWLRKGLIFNNKDELISAVSLFFSSPGTIIHTTFLPASPAAADNSALIAELYSIHFLWYRWIDFSYQLILFPALGQLFIRHLTMMVRHLSDPKYRQRQGMVQCGISSIRGVHMTVQWLST